MIANLAGTRPGHALFTADERAVVVDLRDLTAAGPFPEYEVIPSQWDSSPNPAVVPTKAFTMAEDALSDVTVITASGSRAGKRTYAVPRNVRESAKRALTASGGSDIDRDIAQRLSSGKPVNYATVHHIHLYFSTRDKYDSDSETFWGGPGGQQWAEKIASKEMSLVAAATAKHDVQMTPTGAMNPVKNLPPTEDDPDASITDPLEVVDPKEPHVFVPMSFDNPYDCTYCYAPEGAIIHMCDYRQQIINNFGDPSAELTAYDEELAREDALSAENAGPTMMAGEIAGELPADPEHSIIASAFFANEDDDEDSSCEYHAEYADSDHIGAVYSSHGDGTWRRWNPQAREWEDAGDASEAGLEPLDDNSAYVAAMHQSTHGVEHVPVRDLHTVEWAMADEAGDEIVDEVDAFDSIVPEFFVEAAEDDNTRVTGLYAQRGDTWVVWDPTPGIWVPCPQPSGSLSEVEEDDAEELANWLSSAAGRTEAPDTSNEFALIASVPRVGRRARPANAPGVVPSMGNPGPVSGRSPYASNTLRGGRGNSWAVPARTPSGGGAGGDYAKRVKLAPATTGDQGYTPQERSANAKQQVRDGFGRFARGGSRVAYAGGNGTIKKVDPATKKVQIESDPDSKGKTTTAWVDAKSTRVMSPNHGDETPPQRGGKRRATPPGGSRVDGQPDAGGDLLLPADGPRATRYTAKARLKTMQAPLTRAALTKMLKNAPAYFRAERARARRINRNWNSSDGITASANHDGVMVAFFLDPETAQQFAVPGGEPPEQLHMTLAYLGDQSEAGVDADSLASIVSEWAAKTPPITGEISGHGVFTNGDKPVTHMSVDCPDLPAARQSLIEHLQAAGLSPRMDHGFDPHITLAYADTPVEVPATPVTFNHVTVSHGPNDMAMPMGDAVTAAGTPAAVMTPDNADVTPMYLAVVDKLDKAAVLDLLALVPASDTSDEPVLFKRTAKGWERDDNMMSSLRSATPPPVVTLDAATYKDVVAQVDQTLTADQEPEAPEATAASGVMDLYNEYGELLPALVAAGGLDKNRGNAERLRRYWTVGPGGAKIRWGQGGDWYRCVRHLSKYLGPRAKGYCFSGDTEFTTRDGVMSFADAVGTTQFVLTDHTPVDTGQPVSTSGYWVEAPIMSFGEQPLLTVTLTRGRVTKTIRATPEHRWFVSPNGRNARRYDVGIVTTENLQPGMTLASIWAKKDEDLTPSADGIRAGFIFGDGSRASARSFAVDVWGDKQEDLLRYFSDYPMTERKLATGVLGTRVGRVSVGGVDLKALPDMRNDLDYLYGWLAGYVAADGSVSPAGSLQLWSKDRANLEAAKHVATLLGIKTGVIGSRMRRGYLDHDTEIFWLSFMVNDIPDRLVLRKNHRELLARDGVREKQTGVRWRVVSVEDHGDVEEVFCAVVPETESFVLTDGMWYPNCQLRHQEMVRMSTSQHAKLLRGKGAVRGGGFDYPDEQISVELAAAWERAENAPVVASAAEGAPFFIPIIVPEGVPTGDGRIFKPLAVTHRNLPIPLMWQMKTADGHDGSVVVGRIDSIERVANGLGNAYGVLDTSPHALEVERLIRNGFLRGVSADLDNFEAETTKNEDETLGKSDKSEKIAADTTTISKARVMGVTAVPKPAFQECEIHLIEEEPEQQEDPVIPDGVYAERDDETLVACALVASQIPVVPPADWFSDPGLNEPTPLTVTDDGRVFGHIAAWHVDHIGMPFGTKPPRSRSGYKFFHTGVVRTDNGKDVPVGQLTLAGGHASLELTADAAVKHYDDTHSAVADVHAGEDAHGIWVAGALRPDVDAGRIRSLRASAPSGDWRPIGGRLELVAVCQVNVPGFPVARARVASGYVTALVAAGAAPLAQLKGLSVEDRIKRLEDEALSAKMDALRERMAPAFSARSDELALRASAARERMEALRSSASDLSDYSPDTRETYARKGWAMPDGSFPIANGGDLKNAVRAYGRAATSDRAKVRRHIMKRARGLGRADIIPSSWTSASIEERWQDARAQFAELSQRPVTASASLTAQRDAAIARMSALRAAGPADFDPNKHPRSDETGKFREVLYRLNDAVKDAPNSESTSKEIDHVIELMDDGDLQKVKIATDNLMESVDQIAQQVDVALPDLAHTIREGYAALGEAIARLPLAQGNDQERLRWSDLPPELQSLVDDVMTKLKSHVADEAFRDITSQVSAYKSGIDTATSDEIQSWLARMVKYLLD